MDDKIGTLFFPLRILKMLAQWGRSYRCALKKNKGNGCHFKVLLSYGLCDVHKQEFYWIPAIQKSKFK